MFGKALLFFSAAVLVLLGAANFNEAEAKFSKAKLHGKPFCPKGAFYDPRKGGECWTCPRGTHRTVFGVTSNKACERRAYETFKKAKKTRKNKRVGQGCKKGQFWDVKGGNGLLGACYKCAKGYRRTAHAVNKKKSCAKKVKAAFKKASYSRKFGCPGGQFFDPRKGGQCWSCPKSWLRTVNPVTHAKACTNKPLDVFAMDTGVICRGFINAMKKGVDETEKFAKTLKKFTDPVTKPIDAMMKKLTAQVKSPKELDKLLGQMADAMKGQLPVLAEVKRYQEQVKHKKDKLRNILLNADLICGGNQKKIISALKSAGLKPKLKFKKASLFDGLLIRPAHAAENKVFVAFSVAASAQSPKDPLGFAGAFVLVTDFDKHAQGLVSVGTTKSTSPGAAINFGAMIFPVASIDNFTGIASLGTSFGIAQGDALKKLIEKLPAKARKLVPAGFSISVDPLFQSIPGFGFEWELVDMAPGGGGGKELLTGAVTVDATFLLHRPAP